MVVRLESHLAFLTAMAVFFATGWFLPPAYAAEDSLPSPLSKPPGAGVEWTKIQDLNPQARATNRPVKQKWAVVVGLGRFLERRLCDDLDVMDRSAQEFYQYLLAADGGRFEKDHVRMLLNGNATRQSITTTLGESWLGRVAGPDDLVVVYLATSGFPTTDGSTYLCTYNSALDNIYSTCLSMQDLMETLRKNVHCDRIVLILQAAYSGSAELTSGAKALYSGYNLDLNKVILGKGYVILSSSRPEQISWRDVFSSNLIKALRQKNGLIPLQEAFAIARERTEYDTTHTYPSMRLQTPVMKSDWKGNDLVLGTPPIEQVSQLPEGVMTFLGAESHYLKANNFVGSGNLDASIPEYEAALSTDPGYADCLGDYGAVLAMKGDWKGAAQKYRAALQSRPGDGLFHANYARVLSRLGLFDQSRQELETAYRINPKDRIVLCALADRCLEAGDVERGVSLLREVVKLYPRMAQLHDRLSYALTRAGCLDEALSQAMEAVKLDSSLTSARLNLGSILLLKGNKEGSLAAYKEAVTLSPENPDAHFLLSRTMESMGDLSGARAELSRFLELCQSADPRFQGARQHLTELPASP